jgi:hypothetical protein
MPWQCPISLMLKVVCVAGPSGGTLPAAPLQTDVATTQSTSSVPLLNGAGPESLPVGAVVTQIPGEGADAPAAQVANPTPVEGADASAVQGTTSTPGEGAQAAAVQGTDPVGAGRPLHVFTRQAAEAAEAAAR